MIKTFYNYASKIGYQRFGSYEFIYHLKKYYNIVIECMCKWYHITNIEV
jgi:hypothetical protein